MSIFVNYNQINFYRNLFDELNNSEAREPEAVSFVDFQEAGAVIGKVDDSRWCLQDFNQVSLDLQKHTFYSEIRLLHGFQEVSALAELEAMLRVFEKVKSVAKKLFEKTYCLIVGHPASLDNLIALSQKVLLYAVTDFLKTQNEIVLTDITKKIVKKTYEILLKVEPEVNWEEKINGGNPLLTAAISSDKKKLALSLIEQGVDLEARDSAQRTALIAACIQQDLEVVSALLEKGVRVNNCDSRNSSALQYACEVGSLAIVRKLLAHGAEVNHMDLDQRTPLIEALVHEHDDIARELVRHGADPNRGKDEGDYPLHIAAAYGLSVFEDLLKAKADPHQKNDKGNSAFLVACENGQYAVVKTLLEHYGANINEQNPAGDNALSFVLREQGADRLLKLLIEKGIKKSYFTQFSKGSTLLHKLFFKPSVLTPETFAWLFLNLSSEIDVTLKDKDQRSLFDWFSSPDQTFANKFFKLLFRDFGAAEDAIDTYTIEHFHAYCLKNAQKLIAHPKNHPKANPFAISLLYTSRSLAFEIAYKLSPNEFLQKCQELEQAYPKTPVLEFLYKAFICRPPQKSNHKLIEHIRLLFAYLSRKIDVLDTDEALKTPLEILLIPESKSQETRNIMLALFGKFGAVKERIKTSSTDGFLDYFIQKPEKLIKHPQNVAATANPLEVAFLFGSVKLARAIASKVSKTHFQSYALWLEEVYPKSKTNEFLFGLKFSINPKQFEKGFDLIPEKPQGVEVRNLHNIFARVNFTNPEAAFYINPEAYGLSSNRDDLEKILEDFIVKVETRQEFLGTPKKDTDAIEVFYQIIENAVTNAIKKLEAGNDELLTGRTMAEFLREISKCGGKIFTISIEIFNKVVNNIQADFENRAFTSLGELRSFLARDVIPKSDHSVHDYNKFIKEKGKKLGIPGSAEGEQFEDIYVGSREFNADASERQFLERYTPADVALKWLEPQLKTDAIFRERYVEWWMKHVPEDFAKGHYDPILKKVAELKAQNAEHNQIASYLEGFDICLFGNTQTAEEVVEDARRHSFIEQKVYSDMVTNTFNSELFIESLQKIGVLTPVSLNHINDNSLERFLNAIRYL